MKTHTNFKSINKISLSQHVYHAIKDAIITLELEPGQKIRDVELADSFEVSRTPIREALKQLELEGLVETRPASHTRISEIDEQEVKESFVVVANLHALATKLAIPNMLQEDLLKLKEFNQQLAIKIKQKNSLEAIQADDQFHNLFIRLARNKKIDECIQSLLPQIRRLEYLKFDSTQAQYSIQDHEKIIYYVENGKTEQAALAVEENWLSLSKQLI